MPFWSYSPSDYIVYKKYVEILEFEKKVDKRLAERTYKGRYPGI